jgi:serine/threonine-protein kinase
MEQRYGRYQIRKQLGSGTMGVVFLAHDPQIDRPVALKVLRPDKVVTEEFVHRFLKEARAIGRLTHPNIVVVYDIGRDHGTIYIAMEYVEGRPFDRVIGSGKPDYPTWARVGAQLANTLAYAHEKGIIHRDIKPSNIIMTRGGHLKLTDFGIARIEDPEATLQTRVGDILGTPAYMSPEQVAGQPVDGRSDLFSLGVILYEWLLGQRPFRGASMAAIFGAIANQAPRPPKAIDKDLPQPLADLLFKSLQKTKSDRFQDGRQMAAAIEESCCQLQLEQAPKKGKGRHRWLWRLAGVSCAAMGIIYGGLQLIPQGQNWLMPFPPMASPPDSTLPSSTQAPIQSPPSPTVETPPESVPQEIAPQGDLRVASLPAGAQLYIDGVPKGRTPASLALPKGTYSLRLSLPDHYEWQAAIQLGQGEALPLTIQLDEKK